MTSVQTPTEIKPTASQIAKAYLQASKEFHSKPNEEILEVGRSWLNSLRQEIGKTVKEGLVEPKIDDTTKYDLAGPGEKKGIYFAYKLPDGKCYNTARIEFSENQRKIQAIKDLSETKIFITEGDNGTRFITFVGNIAQTELRRLREISSNIAIIAIAKTENPTHDIENTRRLGKVLLAS